MEINKNYEEHIIFKNKGREYTRLNNEKHKHMNSKKCHSKKQTDVNINEYIDELSDNEYYLYGDKIKY